ncbi:uncharacterized protein LY89DRAFT_612890, partial [Mollisia scopiformis]
MSGQHPLPWPLPDDNLSSSAGQDLPSTELRAGPSTQQDAARPLLASYPPGYYYAAVQFQYARLSSVTPPYSNASYPYPVPWSAAYPNGFSAPKYISPYAESVQPAAPDSDLPTTVPASSIPSDSSTSSHSPLTKTTGVIPPELPPSVEEAYRKKCIELKQRLNEVEEGNDAARQRISRIGRSVQKLRLERAFLLEQLAKRTSTNVEDSEGSPSPPPTPKEKPLRTKRGHRKPDFLTTDLGDGRPGSTFIQQGPVTLSPSSDAFSHTHTHPDPLRNSTPQAQSQPPKRQLPSNGTHAPTAHSTSTPSQSRRPKSPFDLYCNETKPSLVAKTKEDPTYDVESALARGWSSLDGDKKDEYTRKFEQMKRGEEFEKEGGPSAAHPATFDEADEDIEMGEDAATPGGADAGGFTAVN